MKRINDIENIVPGEYVLRSSGLKSKMSQIYIISVRIVETMAWVSWSWSKDSDNYFSTDFRKSENIADFGMWHDLTTQNWAK